MILRTFNLFNKKSQSNYPTVYDFTQFNDFHIINTLVFIPVTKPNKEEILKPKLKQNFSLYIILV